MADSSVQASDQSGSAGAIFGTDLVSSEHYPISKIAFGAYGTINLVDSITTNPFPVALSAVDNAVLDTINTAVELIDDIVYTDDTSTHVTGTSKGAGIMAAATPTDGSVGANDI